MPQEVSSDETSVSISFSNISMEEDNLVQTSNTVPCSECSFPIQPNSSNTCVKCLESKDDITLGLLKKLFLLHCPQCKFYLFPPKIWIKLQPESALLLALCLRILERKIHSNKVRLVCAETISDECNSKRIKIWFNYVQKEVTDGEILPESYVVEFVQHNHICESCSRVQANHNIQWDSVVQLRRHGRRKLSFLQLEQLILQHGVAANAARIQKMKHGTDFSFAEESCAKKFVDFIKEQVPLRICESKELVSHDTRSNFYCFRYIFFVEVCPICCDDMIFLPPKVASSLGNIGPLVICTKVTNIIVLFDPLTSTRHYLDADMYWRRPFKSLLTSKDLVECVILNVDEVYSDFIIDGMKFGLANIEVARKSDLGKNDTRFNIETHLGYVLKSGDDVLGYDLCEVNCSDGEIELEEYMGCGVILMKKRYEKKCQKRGLEHELYLKDLEQITNEIYDMSLGNIKLTLEEMLGGLNLNGEENKEKKKVKKIE